MATIVCPRCEGEHDAPFLRCTCGYDAVATAHWSIALATHLRNRKIAIGSIPVGIAVLFATLGSAMTSIGIFAALIGPVIAALSHSYVNEARRHLTAAKAPSALPQARIL